MNEIFERMNIRVTIITNQGAHERDFVCMDKAVQWWNRELQSIYFSHADYLKWLRSNDASDD